MWPLRKIHGDRIHKMQNIHIKYRTKNIKKISTQYREKIQNKEDTNKDNINYWKYKIQKMNKNAEHTQKIQGTGNTKKYEPTGLLWALQAFPGVEGRTVQ